MLSAGNSIPLRKFLRVAGVAAFWIGSCPIVTQAAPAADAEPDSSAFAPFDREVEAFMQARKVPGGALAVVKDRRLVYARGYGWADREAKEPARPDSLFRIASISKPITAVTVLKLAEAGKLDLDRPAFDIVRLDPFKSSGIQFDSRLQQITVRQLLHHTGGWDRDQSYDPMFMAIEIANALKVPPPAGPREVIRFMLGHRLDFDPGTRYAYSNFGYCVLGRVIEAVAGQAYDEHVRRETLAPIGIHRMRIGASLFAKRGSDEVRYYTTDDAKGRSVFPGTASKVPWPYGGFHLEAMDAHGGWLASAVALARFASALDNVEHSPLLAAAGMRTMYEPPPPPVCRDDKGALLATFYGCGWSVRPVGQAGKANYWHSGSLPGTASLLVRRWDGLSWAVLFNQRSEDSKLPDMAIDLAMHRAAAEVAHWPDFDLFGRYSV